MQLCQDCLAVKNEIEFDKNNYVVQTYCDCGGEFCWCNSCEITAKSLLSGQRGKILGVIGTVDFWTPGKGIRE